MEATYKGRKIFIADKFPVSNKDTLVISIEKTNSKYIQGVCIGIYGSCKVLGKTHKKRKFIDMLFWEDAELIDSKHIELQVFTKENFIFINNIWEAESSPPYTFKEGEKHTCYAGNTEWHGSNRWAGAAMYAEDIKDGRRYFCNDGDPDDDFDDIIFTVRKVDSENK